MHNSTIPRRAAAETATTVPRMRHFDHTYLAASIQARRLRRDLLLPGDTGGDSAQAADSNISPAWASKAAARRTVRGSKLGPIRLRPIARLSRSFAASRGRRLAHWPALVAILGLLLGACIWRGISSSSLEYRPAVSSARLEQVRNSKDRALVAPRTASAHVPRAPVFERLAVASRGSASAVSACSHVVAAAPEQYRSQILRRCQRRRKVPRMNTDEPPWS